MAYFVYILRTSSNTLYIGQTNNLEKRIQEHKKKASKSAKYIRYFPSFDLVYKEKYLTRKEAMQREAKLKNWSKTKKEAIIASNMGLPKKTLDRPAQLKNTLRLNFKFNSHGLFKPKGREKFALSKFIQTFREGLTNNIFQA